MGGTKDEQVAYGLDNLILLCRACHDWVHAHPGKAYARGYLVHSWDHPENIGVTLGVQEGVGDVMFFNSDGTTELIGSCDKLF